MNKSLDDLLSSMPVVGTINVDNPRDPKNRAPLYEPTGRSAEDFARDFGRCEYQRDKYKNALIRILAVHERLAAHAAETGEDCNEFEAWGAKCCADIANEALPPYLRCLSGAAS